MQKKSLVFKNFFSKCAWNCYIFSDFYNFFEMSEIWTLLFGFVWKLYTQRFGFQTSWDFRHPDFRQSLCASYQKIHAIWSVKGKLQIITWKLDKKFSFQLVTIVWNPKFKVRVWDYSDFQVFRFQFPKCTPLPWSAYNFFEPAKLHQNKHKNILSGRYSE